MARIIPVLAATILAAITPANAAGDPSCKLCLDARKRYDLRPLRIEIENGIAFSRLALIGRGDGQATIDEQTGHKRTSGNMVDLGGFAFQGSARIVGEPFHTVHVDMPAHVILRSPSGGEADLTDFETNLPALPALDANGTLGFSFGGRLNSRNGNGGNFRGRIPIRVDYN